MNYIQNITDANKFDDIFLDKLNLKVYGILVSKKIHVVILIQNKRGHKQRVKKCIQKKRK
jgi:hypothetical protein